MSKHQPWHLSAEAAELYEHCVALYILGPWVPLLVDAAALAEGERVLDVACGTGVVARAAAKRAGSAGRVVGVDLNPAMIGVARSLPVPTGAPIEWLERDALDLRFADVSFDVVLCQQGLQFFSDKAAALKEIRRVLERGGRLALSVWANPGLYNSAVGEALAHFVNALAHFVNNETAIRFCASRQAPTREEIQHLAMEAGFSAVEVGIRRINAHLPRLDEFTLDHLAATPVAPVIAAAHPDTRKKIGASVMNRLQRYADGDGVTYPEEAHVLTARVA